MSPSTLPRRRTRLSRTHLGRTDIGATMVRRLRRLLRDDAGMSTVEYAIGLVAAAGFAALLYSIVTGDSVTAALTQLVQRALTAGS